MPRPGWMFGREGDAPGQKTAAAARGTGGVQDAPSAPPTRPWRPRAHDPNRWSGTALIAGARTVTRSRACSPLSHSRYLIRCGDRCRKDWHQDNGTEGPPLCQGVRGEIRREMQNPTSEDRHPGPREKAFKRVRDGPHGGIHSHHRPPGSHARSRTATVLGQT